MPLSSLGQRAHCIGRLLQVLLSNRLPLEDALSLIVGLTCLFEVWLESALVPVAFVVCLLSGPEDLLLLLGLSFLVQRLKDIVPAALRTALVTIGGLWARANTRLGELQLMVPLNDLLGQLLLTELPFANEQVLYPDLNVPLLSCTFKAFLQLVKLSLGQLARPLVDGGPERVLVA